MRRLRTLWQRVRSERALRRNVLILAVAVVLGLTAGGVILSQQRAIWPWQSRHVFWATFDEAPAVSPGNGQEVRIAGVSVGQITSARVSGDGKAQLQLSIEDKYPVYDNATVVLRPKSPLNEMYVELDPGDNAGKPLPEDGVLPAGHSRSPVQVDEVLAHLDTSTRAALTTLLNESDVALAKAPEQLAGGVGATDQVARDLQPVVARLQTRKDTLAKLVTALSQISKTVGGDDTRLADLAGTLQQTLQSVGANSGPLDQALSQLPGLAGQLKQATDSVQSLSGELDPTLDNLRQASGTLPDSLSRLTKTVDQIGSTVDAARPVIDGAVPVVRDLRPVVGDLNASLPDLHEITARLDPVTAGLVPYLGDLGAFVYNTTSVGSLRDANGGITRGLVEFTPSSLPLLKNLSSPTRR